MSFEGDELVYSWLADPRHQLEVSKDGDRLCELQAKGVVVVADQLLLSIVRTWCNVAEDEGILAPFTWRD